jgi:hypothetical protein
MIPDYSEPLIFLRQLREKAHQALLMKDYKKAVDLADEIVIEARKMRIYCLDQLEKQ